MKTAATVLRDGQPRSHSVDPAPATIPRMLLDRADRAPDGIVFREKIHGYWRAVTWGQFADDVRHLALALIDEGVEPGEIAAILSNNAVAWAVADVAIQAAGGISAGLYPTVPPAQIEFLLADSRARFIFVQDAELLDKVLAAAPRLPALERIVVFKSVGLIGPLDPRVMLLADFLAVGRARAARDPAAFPTRLAARGADDHALLIYSSGTSGPPKGALVTHRNVLGPAAPAIAALDLRPGDQLLSFLPLCHGAERLTGYYYALMAGAVLNFVESWETISENACEVRPTRFSAVPRVWEKMHATVTLRLAAATRFQRWASRNAFAVGSRCAAVALAGGRPGPALRCAQAIADLTVFRPIRSFLGLDRTRVLITGAAPTSPELIGWFLSLGCRLRDCYGQTEAAGLIALMPPDATVPGSVGRAVPWMEVRITDDHEILVRGPTVFAGYLNRPDATAETLAGGWLHTGDLGRLDGDGYLFIVDRKKDVLITAGGKNIAPQEIERELKFSPYIADAVVFGDRRKYLVCLILLDSENTAQYAQDHGIVFEDHASLCRTAEILALVDVAIARVNERLARVETIKKFRIIEQRLTPEDESMTPTMKLKRKYIGEKYRSLIEAMYDN